MKIVIIGGTRFMGPHVVRSLKARGHDVTVFHRGVNCNDVTHVHGDRLAPPRDLHGDLLIDMWCMTEAHACSAAEHFRDERRVLISSADVYRNYDGLRGRYNGPPDPIPLREDAPLREVHGPKRMIPPLVSAAPAAGWFGYLLEGLAALAKAPALAVMEYLPGELT